VTFLLHSQHPQHNSYHKTTIPATCPQKSYGNIHITVIPHDEQQECWQRERTGRISLSCRLVSKHESDLYLRHTLLNPKKHGHQTVNNTITMQDSTHFPGIACYTGLINRKVSSELASNSLWNQLRTCAITHHLHVVEHGDDALLSLAWAKISSGPLHN